MRKILLVLLFFVGGASLAACGSSISHVKAYTPSKNCAITASNFNLAGCNFENANLQKVDLQGDDLRRANLANANLSGADIQGANVKGAVTIGLRSDATTVCTNGYDGPCTGPELRGSTGG